MTRKTLVYLVLVVGLLSLLVAGIANAAEGFAQPTSPNAMAAMSPFSDYMAAAISYVLLTGVLVTVLLGGGMAVLNFGLLSKRNEDLVGKRTPSDLGLFKNRMWPNEPEEKTVLPAEERENENVFELLYERSSESNRYPDPTRGNEDDLGDGPITQLGIPLAETLRIDPVHQEWKRHDEAA